MNELLPTRDPGMRVPTPTSLDPDTLRSAGTIVDTVRDRGDTALRDFIERFEGRSGDPLVLDRTELDRAASRLAPESRDVLTRTADRIRGFAVAQKECLAPLTMAIPGGTVGHNLAPVDRAGCYAPGGRFPLPSSVLMTAITARAAGVREVWVISPSSDDIMLAAASIAGADGLIWAGGAHGIAAAAYGTQTVSAVDIIVGPGNRWVTAAKKLVSGQVGIDMLAGPSELVVMADESADPTWVAADLLAQAEHDPDAVPILVTTSAGVVSAVRGELERQLKELDTAAIAAHSIRHGASIVCGDWDEAVATVNAIGPEHLEVQHADADELVPRLRNYGGLFIGSGSAEVLGDYGAGPNHVLPTSGTARYTGGLSVFDFLRVRTWMEITDAEQAHALYADAETLATMEGLSGHAISARVRRSNGA